MIKKIFLVISYVWLSFLALLTLLVSLSPLISSDPPVHSLFDYILLIVFSLVLSTPSLVIIKVCRKKNKAIPKESVNIELDGQVSLKNESKDESNDEKLFILNKLLEHNVITKDEFIAKQKTIYTS